MSQLHAPGFKITNAPFFENVIFPNTREMTAQTIWKHHKLYDILMYNKRDSRLWGKTLLELRLVTLHRELKVHS